MSNTSKFHFFPTSFILILLLVFTCASPVCADSIPNLPERMFWSCYDVGGTGYTQASAIADAMSRKFGVKIRLLPSGTSIGRLLPVINQKVDLGFLGSEVWASVEGIDAFTTYEWGPQDVRVVLAKPNTFGAATTKKSGIKTFKDIKGKRFAYVAASPPSASRRTPFSPLPDLPGTRWKRLILPASARL